jgi:hypothetical protein
MREHFLGRPSSIRVPVKHLKQEVSECLCFWLFETVFLNQNLFQRPVTQTSYSSQMSSPVKESLV